MSREVIFEKLKDVFAMVNGEDGLDTMTESTKLVEELGLNSIGMLYMIIAIEENFSVRFESVGINDFETVGGVIDYIEGQSK